MARNHLVSQGYNCPKLGVGQSQTKNALIGDPKSKPDAIFPTKSKR
jgi:hypothetical protein